MKTTAIFIFLALFMSNIALAEKGEKRQKREKPDIDALIVQFKLTSAEGEKFKAILKEQKQTKKAGQKKTCDKKKKTTDDQRQKARKKREAQRDAMDEKLLTVLSYEQLYKYRKYMRQFKHKKSKGKGKNKQKGCKK